MVEKTYDLGVAQTLTWYYSGAKYTRTCSNVQTDEWSAWEKIAIATPPQRYVLQLADGWVRVNAAEYMRATKQFNTVDAQNKIAITTGELQAMLSCGRHSAVQIGDAAEARIQIGKRVFWNVEKVKTYVDLISG